MSKGKMENRWGMVDKACGWISHWTLQESNAVLWLAAAVQNKAVTLAGGRDLTIEESLFSLFMTKNARRLRHFNQ